MRVKIEFDDNTAFTAEEAEQRYKTSFGEGASIEVLPRNNSNDAYLYFALQNLITVEQLELFFEYYPYGYPDKLDKLKEEVMLKVSNILDKVIQNNESKVME